MVRATCCAEFMSVSMQCVFLQLNYLHSQLACKASMKR